MLTVHDKSTYQTTQETTHSPRQYKLKNRSASTQFGQQSTLHIYIIMKLVVHTKS